MTTSQKHRNFVAEPMGEKSVQELAGIGDVLGQRLSERGFDKAYVVLGQYLVLKKDEDLFKTWLYDTCNANKKQQNDCYQCLKEWCDSFFLCVDVYTSSWCVLDDRYLNRGYIHQLLLGFVRFCGGQQLHYEFTSETQTVPVGIDGQQAGNRRTWHRSGGWQAVTASKYLLRLLLAGTVLVVQKRRDEIHCVAEDCLWRQ